MCASPSQEAMWRKGRGKDSGSAPGCGGTAESCPRSSSLVGVASGSSSWSASSAMDQSPKRMDEVATAHSALRSFASKCRPPLDAFPPSPRSRSASTEARMMAPSGDRTSRWRRPAQAVSTFSSSLTVSVASPLALLPPPPLPAPVLIAPYLVRSRSSM